MSLKAKVPLVLLIVLIFLSLVLAGGIYYLFQKERSKNIDLKAELDDVNAKYSLTETKLNSSEKLISELNSKLQEASLRVERLNTDLKRELTSKQEAVTKLEQLRVDLEKQKELRLDLEKKLSKVQGELSNAQAQLSALETQKKFLETKVKDLENQTSPVELGQIVVGPSDNTAQTTSGGFIEDEIMSTGPEAKVLVVNKDYNFAVLSLGSKDGIKLGDIFSIYHNKQYLGDVKVEKIHDSMSAAGFLSQNILAQISEGDRAIKKAK